MNILEDVMSKFPTSKAIFTGQIDNDGFRVEFSLKEPYNPQTDAIVDPIESTIARLYSERLNDSRRRMVHSVHLSSVYEDIVRDVMRLYEERSPLKNPTQSKVYKWMRDMKHDMHHPAAEGFIGIFRYMHTVDVKLLSNPDTMDNVLTILEMMMEKYEAKY